MSSQEPILVTGATGAQGGATARSLLAAGFPVRFLTRRPNSPEAGDLIRLGAQSVAGDYNDGAALDAATRGTAGVFSVQIPDFSGNDNERRHGRALMEAAIRNRVPQIVHASVSGCGRHTKFPRWQEGYWHKSYWTDKWDVEEIARGAGFTHWTVLRPAFLMENFAQPKAKYMFPHLASGEIATALSNTTRLQLFSADDVGSFACAAFRDPQRYHGLNMELAVEALTMPEVASILAAVTHRPVTAQELTPEQALSRGLSAGWVRSQEWSNEVGYSATIADVQQYGIPLTTFEHWARRHREQIVVGIGV